MSALGDPMAAGLTHATCVYWPEAAAGVLLTGPSGAGKSDLALRLIDRGWVLVADDQVRLDGVDGAVWGQAPDALGGKIAVAGVGIVTVPYQERCAVRLCVGLEQVPPRFPLDNSTRTLCGIPLPFIRLNGQSASAPLRIEHALRHFAHDT